jgi:hypothetical protein
MFILYTYRYRTKKKRTEHLQANIVIGLKLKLPD